MQWSMEFEIVALIISVILLFNIKSLRVLPMKSGRLFVHALIIQLVCIIIDIVSSEMDVMAHGRLIGLQMCLNTVYFESITVFFALFQNLFAALSCEKRGKYYRPKPAGLVPPAIMTFLVIMNLFNGILYTVTADNGYQRGWGYYYIWFPYILVELAIGVFYVMLGRGRMSRRVRYSSYLAAVCIVIASAYQVYVEPGRLLLCVSTAMGMVILYLAMIDSDNDNEMKTGTYNTKGFRRYMTERLLSGRAFHAYFIQIEGYSSLLSVFGRVKTDNLLWCIGRDLMKKERLTFYLHTGLFAVIAKNETVYQNVQDHIDQITAKDRYIDGEKAEMSYRVMMVDETCGFSDSAVMCSVVCDSIREPNYDREKYSLITDKDVSESAGKVRLKQALYRALNSGGVRVYYQPIFDNESNKIHSAEALARIYDDDMGLIFPDNFIPLFEKDGTILKFGKIIFENVCRFIRDNDMEDLGLEYIEVNLSPIQCMQPSLPDDLIAIAEDYGVDMKYFNFEITETASLSAESLLHLMTELIDRGASFSVDDFGTGYSNIIRVSSLPFRLIKIDKSILWDYFRTKDEMVPRIYDMMHCKGFAMVTEGVETEDMHNWLRDEAGCRYEQGYLYSKPIDEKSFLEYVRKVNNKETA